jgi:membrane protease YdiL (CAAX protease family)
VDTGTYRLLAPHSRSLALAPDLRLTSMFLLVVMVVSTRPGLSLRWVLPPRKVVIVAVCWVAASAWWVHATGIGKIQLDRWQDVVAFLFTGLVAEELLCRGLVLGAALKTFNGRSARWMAVLWSAGVFALMHHQYHGFRFDSGAWMQVLWTLPFGVVLGLLTERTRSLLPALLVHFVNNVLVFVA